MNLTDLLDKIYSKKTSIAITGLVVMAYIEAPPEQMTIVVCAAVVMQGVIDVIKIWKKDKDDPGTGQEIS